MKILLVHNFYGSDVPSGENLVVQSECQMLRSQGHQVEMYSRCSDEIRSSGVKGLIKGALSTPWNQFSANSLNNFVSKFRPDVMHVHNTFPLISPSIFHVVNSGVARVLTLHNYRLLCPSAIPMQGGRVCVKCITEKNVLPSLVNGCYRSSRLATLPLGINVALHRFMGTWRKKVDAFIALSEFQSRLMVEGGLPNDKMHVKPNFYPGSPLVQSWGGRENYIVFVGRLGAEKGVRALLRAWRMWGNDAPELRLIGDGELRGELEAAAQGLPVRFLGKVDADVAQRQIANSRLLILPSEWFEGFPMVVREAFAFGTPVAVSNIGPLPSIVQDGVSGLIFEPSNPESLLDKVRVAWCNQSVLRDLAIGARNEFISKYNENVNYQQLLGIYQSALVKAKERVNNV